MVRDFECRRHDKGWKGSHYRATWSSAYERSVLLNRRIPGFLYFRNMLQPCLVILAAKKKKRKNEMRNWFQIFIIDLVQPPPSLPSPPLLRFAIPSISILKISLMKLANDLSLNGQSFFDENVTINISINHPYPSPSSYSMKGTNCYEASEKRNP